MTSALDIVEVQVRDGHVTLEQAYVYCWFHPHDATVVYVGATWLHPAARAELHLHGSDPEVRVVGDWLARAGIDATTPMRVLAFRVPSSLDRQAARIDLIGALAQEGWLSDDYGGPFPEVPRQQERTPVSAWTATVIAFLREQAV
ncbi:MAG TPA: hypothetical protein VGD69_05465 [Herpetosiphonaceae bacterium]